MRLFLRTLAVALTALLVASCGSTVGGNAAATVNGTEVSRELLERIVAAETAAAQESMGEDGEDAEMAAQLQRDILTALISFAVIADLAEEQGVAPSEEDLEAALDEDVEMRGGEEPFEDFLEQLGLSREEYRDLLLANNLRYEALAEASTVEISEEELREAYELQRESRYETRTTRHILVEDEGEADDVVAQLEDGADFAELAQEVSTDEGSGAQGGDLDANPRGVFVPEFEDAVWGAEIGDLVGPVESQFGFHVIEVLDEQLLEFEDVRDELAAELEGPEAQAAVEQLVTTAIAEADIEVDPGLGEWDAEQGRVVDPDQVGQAPGDDDSEVEPGAPGDEPVPGGELPTEEEMQNMSEEELMELMEELMGDMEEPAAP